MRSKFKMKFFGLAIIGAVFVWTPLPSSAQAETLASGAEMRRVVSLKDLLDMAWQKSPGLKVKKYEYEAARSKVFGAFLPMDPMIGIDVESQPDVFDYDGRVNNEYMIQQTIPFPTKLFLKGTIASREADIAYQKYKEEARDTAWHIEQPYYELYLAKKTLEALEENQRLLEQLARAVQARYESGQAAQDDLLKIQIELSKNSIEVFNWKEKTHIQEAHFSHLLDEPLETKYVIVNDDARSVLSYSRPELDRMAVEKRPELKALEIGIQRAKDSRTLVLTEWLPDITFKYEGRQFKGEDSVSENDTFIGVTLPIWSLFKGIGGTWKSSEDELKAAEAMYTEMRNEVLLALHQAYSKVKAARNALNVYEHSILPQAKLQVEVALASYEAGRVDFMSVIDAERTLRNTQIEYHKAVAEYEMGLSDLRLAVGDDLAPLSREENSNEIK